MLTLQTPGAGLLSGLDWLPPQQRTCSPAAPSRGVGACGQVQVSAVSAPLCPLLGRAECRETNTDYGSLNPVTPTEEELSILARMKKQRLRNIKCSKPQVTQLMRWQEPTRAGSRPSHWTRLPPADTQIGEKAKAALGPGQCVRHTEMVQGESSSR